MNLFSELLISYEYSHSSKKIYSQRAEQKQIEQELSAF